jgi:hypothetical protein
LIITSLNYVVKSDVKYLLSELGLNFKNNILIGIRNKTKIKVLKKITDKAIVSVQIQKMFEIKL